MRGWDGVMQSYYVDQWEHTGILLEATFTPLAFGGAWLLGAGAATSGRCSTSATSARSASTSATSPSGRVGLGAEGSLRASYKLTDERRRQAQPSASPAPPKSTSPPAPPRSIPTSPASGCCKPGDLAEFEATTFKPSELRLEAFHPMGTARIAADPREGACGIDGSVHGTRDLYVADASLFPTSVGVNPMMTIIAFAKQVARGLAAEAASAATDRRRY